ncbi:hypothetical protein ACFYX8_00590 [Streptomyces cyaneofuscatus]|uniref:hypothetical protein n=1 Tax=Streptomyces cyaneofuscatus TaxID=66883 RepID=UPI003684FA30
MKTDGYWLHPEPIAALLAAAGEAAIVLTYAEDRAFAGVSLNRFASVNSTRLDWRGAEVLERSEEFDGDGLREMVRRYGAEGELVVVFWGNHAVPPRSRWRPKPWRLTRRWWWAAATSAGSTSPTATY